MSEEVTSEEVEGFAEKLEAFSQTLSEREQAMLADMVAMAANIDPEEVVGFADFGMRHMVVGLPFGRPLDLGGGSFGPPVLRANEVQSPPKWNN